MTTTSPLKQGMTIAALVAVILGCWAWLYFTQFAAPAFNLPLHQGTGEVMAEETAKLLDHKGQIVLLTISPRQFPELKAQLDTFTKTLKATSSITIKETHLIEANDPKYGVGRGLSAKRYLQTVKKHPDADAIVSFIGIPNFTEEELSQLSKDHPKFIAEVRSTDRALKLLDKGVLQRAIVSRFVFPAPGPKQPKSPREWFDRYFQVVTPAPKQSAGLRRTGRTPLLPRTCWHYERRQEVDDKIAKASALPGFLDRHPMA